MPEAFTAPLMEPDPDWLSGILDAPVVAVRSESLGVFSSEVSRLHVTFETEEPDKPTRLILKRPGRGMRVGESFRMEGRFYGEVAGSLDVRLPRCWAEGDDYLLLEDVAFQAFDWHKGASAAHTQAALDALRRVHDVTPPAWVPNFGDPDLRARLADAFDQAWDRFRRQFDTLLPDFTPIGDSLYGRRHAFLARLGDTRALLQGDAHLENLPLLEASPEVVVFDWQGPRAGHGLFDVAYFLVMSLPPAERRRIEPQMLQFYLGHTPDEAERDLYGRACLARAAGIVELTAEWKLARFANEGFHWVIERCLQGAVDHATNIDTTRE